MSDKRVKKVVLAYSGGLDTSIILKWLQTTYACEVVTFTADLGQGEELEPARRKAQLLGIKDENIFIEDLREEFVRDYVFPMFRANAQYEGLYLLGTSIARPLIAKKQIEIAERIGADAVAHGATGKGNDQVRFELTYYALKPDVTVIAPWREWDLRSREQLIAFAEAHQIPIAKDKRGEAPFSVDANLLHASSEGKVLEDPVAGGAGLRLLPHHRPRECARQGDGHHGRFRARRPGRDRRKKTLAGGAAGPPQRARPGERHRPARPRREPLRRHEDRAACTRRPAARSSSRRTAASSRSRSTAARPISRTSSCRRYAELIYNGFWFAPEREMLQAAIDKSQEMVTGSVRLKLYKGSAWVIGRESPNSLYDQELVTFEEGAVAYDHRDAAGFIKLNALRLRTLAQRKRKVGDVKRP